MKFTTSTLLALFVTSTLAFTPQKTSTKTVMRASTVTDQSKPIYDPLGLYPKSAPERKEGLIQPLESDPLQDKTLTDPMNMYSDKSILTKNEMSASLPFLKRPDMLDGSLPGDRGFDPFNFSGDENALQWYRTAEVKHARLAMLAAAGWPIAELFDKKIASLLHLKPLLVFQDRVPSILNGGLDRTPAVYWAAALGVAFAIESFGIFKAQKAQDAGALETPGDLSFDPLNLAGKTLEDRKFQMEAELFNGRMAMLAITYFAFTEWWTQNSIINETPIFFKPINVALEQLQDAAGNM